MARRRFHLITTTCRRCGRPVATGNRSLYGLDALKAQWDRICQSCMTPEESDALLRTMGEQIVAQVQP